MCQMLVDKWLAAGAKNVDSTIPDELALPHDCISIKQPKGKTEIVYQKLKNWI